MLSLIHILDDGRDVELLADLVIVCAGVKPNVEFLENTSIEYNKIGLLFNEKGETNVKDVYGAGDVSGNGTIWSVAVKEGIVATSNMAGKIRVMDDFFFAKSTMNFFEDVYKRQLVTLLWIQKITGKELCKDMLVLT